MLVKRGGLKTKKENHGGHTHEHKLRYITPWSSMTTLNMYIHVATCTSTNIALICIENMMK